MPSHGSAEARSIQSIPLTRYPGRMCCLPPLRRILRIASSVANDQLQDCVGVGFFLVLLEAEKVR